MFQQVTFAGYLSPYLPHLPVAYLDASMVSRNVEEVTYDIYLLRLTLKLGSHLSVKLC